MRPKRTATGCGQMTSWRYPPPSLFKKVHVCILQPLAAASLLVKVILGQHGVVVVGRDDQDLDAFATASPDFYST